MGRSIGKKSNRVIRTLGRKSGVFIRTLGRKLPNVLSETGAFISNVSKMGETVGGLLTIAGVPEIGGPLIGISEVGKYSGRGISGVANSAKNLQDGDYGKMVVNIEKTIIDAKRDKKKYDKNNKIV